MALRLTFTAALAALSCPTLAVAQRTPVGIAVGEALAVTVARDNGRAFGLFVFVLDHDCPFGACCRG